MYRMMNNHINVIWALVIRQIEVTRAVSGGLVYALCLPLQTVALLIFVRGMLFGGGISSPQGMLHLVIGVLMFGMFTRIVGECRNAAGFGNGIFNFPCITPIDLFISKTIVYLYLYGFLLIVLSVVVNWYWDASGFDLTAWEYALLGWPLLALVSMGFGIFVNAVVHFYPLTRPAFTILLGPMFFLSGVIFDVTNMSPLIQELAKWNPVAIGLQLVRFGFGIGVPDAYLNMGYMAACAISLTTVGLLVGRHIWKAKLP